LDRKRLAVVGVSRNPGDFTRSLFTELRRQKYDVVPVNPAVTELDGLTCYGRVKDVSPPVEGALLLTTPGVTGQVVEECAEAGIRRIWMFGAIGAGAVSQEAVKYCEAHQIRLIAGECPFMFLPDGAWPHRAHRFCRKLLGRYPK